MQSLLVCRRGSGETIMIGVRSHCVEKSHHQLRFDAPTWHHGDGPVGKECLKELVLGLALCNIDDHMGIKRAHTCVRY